MSIAQHVQTIRIAISLEVCETAGGFRWSPILILVHGRDCLRIKLNPLRFQACQQRAAKDAHLPPVNSAFSAVFASSDRRLKTFHNSPGLRGRRPCGLCPLAMAVAVALSFSPVEFVAESRIILAVDKLISGCGYFAEDF